MPELSNDKAQTLLANERTFLAYIRTAFTTAAFGVVALKFFTENSGWVTMGWISIGLGVLIFLRGVYITYIRTQWIKTERSKI